MQIKAIVMLPAYKNKSQFKIISCCVTVHYPIRNFSMQVIRTMWKRCLIRLLSTEAWESKAENNAMTIQFCIHVIVENHQHENDLKKNIPILTCWCK